SSLIIFNHPMAQVYLRKRPALHWVHLLDGYERVLFFLYAPTSKAVWRLHHWGFRGLLLALLALATGRLVRERCWERLALIIGLAASLSIFHFVAGPNMLRASDPHRYGIVFLLPTSLAVACLLRAVVRTPASQESPGPALHRVPLAVALVLG